MKIYHVILSLPSCISLRIEGVLLSSLKTEHHYTLLQLRFGPFRRPDSQPCIRLMLWLDCRCWQKELDGGVNIVVEYSRGLREEVQCISCYDPPLKKKKSTSNFPCALSFIKYAKACCFIHQFYFSVGRQAIPFFLS